MVSLELVFGTTSLLLSFLVFIILLANLILWKKTKISSLKAKVFLDDTFLKNNFIMFTVFGIIIGISVGFHIFMEMVQLGEAILPFSLYRIAFFFYYAGLVISLLCIVLLGVFWHNILQKGLK